jgi:V8-like Glu-specific endopeptidase
MWTANGSIIWDDQRQAFHRISTYGGQSGSPVFATGCTQSRQAIAIQARGAGGFHPRTNAATRITQASSVNFLDWASDGS